MLFNSGSDRSHWKLLSSMMPVIGMHFTKHYPAFGYCVNWEIEKWKSDNRSWWEVALGWGRGRGSGCEGMIPKTWGVGVGNRWGHGEKWSPVFSTLCMWTTGRMEVMLTEGELRFCLYWGQLRRGLTLGWVWVPEVNPGEDAFHY